MELKEILQTFHIFTTIERQVLHTFGNSAFCWQVNRVQIDIGNKNAFFHSNIKLQSTAEIRIRMRI